MPVPPANVLSAEFIPLPSRERYSREALVYAHREAPFGCSRDGIADLLTLRGGDGYRADQQGEDTGDTEEAGLISAAAAQVFLVSHVIQQTYAYVARKKEMPTHTYLEGMNCLLRCVTHYHLLLT